MDAQLIEQMTAVFEKVFEDADYQQTPSPLAIGVAKDAMQAAAEVQQKYILDAIGGPVTDVEWVLIQPPPMGAESYDTGTCRVLIRSDFDKLIAARVAKYTEPQERVTVPMGMLEAVNENVQQAPWLDDGFLLSVLEAALEWQQAQKAGKPNAFDL